MATQPLYYCFFIPNSGRISIRISPAELSLSLSMKVGKKLVDKGEATLAFVVEFSEAGKRMMLDCIVPDRAKQAIHCYLEAMEARQKLAGNADQTLYYCLFSPARYNGSLLVSAAELSAHLAKQKAKELYDRRETNLAFIVEVSGTVRRLLFNRTIPGGARRIIQHFLEVQEALRNPPKKG